MNFLSSFSLLFFVTGLMRFRVGECGDLLSFLIKAVLSPVAPKDPGRPLQNAQSCRTRYGCVFKLFAVLGCSVDGARAVDTCLDVGRGFKYIQKTYSAIQLLKKFKHCKNCNIQYGDYGSHHTHRRGISWSEKRYVLVIRMKKTCVSLRQSGKQNARCRFLTGLMLFFVGKCGASLKLQWLRTKYGNKAHFLSKRNDKVLCLREKY